MPGKQIFCVKHWGPNHEGTGATIVVAPSEALAREAVWEYLTKKPGGNTQCQSMSLLEVERHEESDFVHEPLSADQFGVRLEYYLPPDESIYYQLLYMNPSATVVADELDQLQAPMNKGGGVSCVKGICAYLRMGQLTQAKTFVNTDSDKIRNYPDIVAVLKRIGFWYESRLKPV